LTVWVIEYEDNKTAEMREIRAKTQGKMGGMGNLDKGAKVQVGDFSAFFYVFFGFWVRCETFFRD